MEDKEQQQAVRWRYGTLGALNNLAIGSEDLEGHGLRGLSGADDLIVQAARRPGWRQSILPTRER